jgi:alpha-L-rhamnosidase
MGLLDDRAWSASEWVGIQSSSREALPAPFLRKQFIAGNRIKRATVYACGLGYAELHLNGKKLGETTERDPGYTNFNKRVLYIAHDVTSSIKPGPNALGAILGTGWFDVHDIATWRFENAPWRGRPRLRLALFIDYTDGRTQTVVTDSTWRASSGPILFNGIYTGEIYDARLEMPGWDSSEFNDRSWSAVDVMPAPKGMLAARECPPVAITESIKPVRISETGPGVYLVDFGQNIAGHAQIRVKGPAGTRITMRYSERVRGDGAIERSQIDTFMAKTTPPQPFQTDTYICKGSGVEEWEQRFSYSGFRYMEVSGFPGKVTSDSFRARFAHTNFESAGEFACSNEVLNKIQRSTRYSYLSNSQSIPTDCPQREKNGWMGDAHLAAEAGLMNFKSASFYTKWLDDLRDDQGAKGNMSLIIPTGGWGRGACHPAWDSAYEIIADDLYKYCGDARILESHYENLRRYVDFLYGQTKDDVVPFDSLGDWVPWSTETSSQLTSTIFLYVDALIVSKAAHIQGNQDDATKYADLAGRVKVGYIKQFLTPEMLQKSSQTTLSMAIYFGLVDGNSKAQALDALIQNVQTQGHIDTGILGAKFVLRVLSEAGRTDLAYKLVTRKEQPSWAWWIGQGATTLWEDWKGESSLNHIMFGDVSNWFFQWIAGIGLDSKSPAFHHILIHPQPVNDLTWAKAIEDSPYGKIKSSWRRTDSRFHLDVTIPANTSATVWIPGTCQAPEGARLVKQEGSGTVLEVGSGQFAFESSLK